MPNLTNQLSMISLVGDIQEISCTRLTITNDQQSMVSNAKDSEVGFRVSKIVVLCQGVCNVRNQPYHQQSSSQPLVLYQDQRLRLLQCSLAAREPPDIQSPSINFIVISSIIRRTDIVKHERLASPKLPTRLFGSTPPALARLRTREGELLKAHEYSLIRVRRQHDWLHQALEGPQQ